VFKGQGGWAAEISFPCLPVGDCRLGDPEGFRELKPGEFQLGTQGTEALGSGPHRLVEIFNQNFLTR